MGMTLIIMAIGIIIPMSPLAHYFKLEALPLSYFPWLIAILVCYAALIQGMKRWYSNRYGWQ
jgi:Mg2+-importing ATPase